MTLCGTSAETLSQKNTNPKTTSSPSAYLNKGNVRIKQLFARFTAIYGYVWQNQYKQNDCILLAAKEWEETLRPIDNESLEKGIQHCKKRCELPPTLPFFYQICRNFQAGSHLKVIAKIEPQKSISPIGENCLKEMKEKLKQKMTVF